MTSTEPVFSSLSSLGNATVVTPPPAIAALVMALNALGWEAEAVPARSRAMTASSTESLMAPLPAPLLAPLPSMATAHTPHSGASSLTEWWIAARPCAMAAPLAAPLAEGSGEWEMYPAWQWDLRMRSRHQRQAS